MPLTEKTEEALDEFRSSRKRQKHKTKFIRKTTSVYGNSYAVGPKNFHLWFGVSEFHRDVSLVWNQWKSIGITYHHA